MESIKHVAVIMDGNGRWACQRSKPRYWGHIRGARIVKSIVVRAAEMGLSSLTLYAFSTENWSRPAMEISILIRLMDKFIDDESLDILSNDIRFKVIGSVEKLPRALRKKVCDLEESSKHNGGMKLVLAFGYGGRQELVRSVQKILDDQACKKENITEEFLQKYLDEPEISNVDLMIRTGGEHRISNFLLWQMAYAELFFTQTLWPDFSATEFERIVKTVNKRERRFGYVTMSEYSLSKALAHSQSDNIFESF